MQKCDYDNKTYCGRFDTYIMNLLQLFQNHYKKTARLICEAKTIIVMAGAGMSADSGIPVFRGADGLWTNQGKLAQATAQRFWVDPDSAWSFYRDRIEECRASKRHKGYEILEGWGKDRSIICQTTNIDGALTTLGPHVELHGSLNRMQCVRPCSELTWNTPALLPSHCPSCSSCGDNARPNVLMFGDRSFVREHLIRQETGFNAALFHCFYPCIILEIGAGQGIPTLRSRAAHLAHRINCPLVRINIEDDPPPNGIMLRGRAEEVLQRLDLEMQRFLYKT